MAKATPKKALIEPKGKPVFQSGQSYNASYDKALSIEVIFDYISQVFKNEIKAETKPEYSDYKKNPAIRHLTNFFNHPKFSSEILPDVYTCLNGATPTNGICPTSGSFAATTSVKYVCPTGATLNGNLCIGKSTYPAVKK